jgi:hypothetical protein
MNRTELLNQLASCNEHISATDQNIFEQERRVDVATTAASLSSNLLKRFQEMRQTLLKRQDMLILQIANSDVVS